MHFLLKDWGVKMGDESNTTAQQVQTKKETKSLVEEFDLADKLPVGIASDIRILELRAGEEMKDGDIHDIYSSACLGFTMQGEKAPKYFKFIEVRKFYGKQ